MALLRCILKVNNDHRVNYKAIVIRQMFVGGGKLEKNFQT